MATSVRRRKQPTRRNVLLIRWVDQQAWVDAHGATLAGYVARYGAQAGPGIYSADLDKLVQYEHQYKAVWQ